MYRILRDIHLLVAMFLFAFLLAYAVSAVEFAHRKWFPHPERITEETRKLQPRITDARVLARQWRGELGSIEMPPGELRFRVATPLGTTYDVQYAVANGETKIRTTKVSFLTTLAFIHISQGTWAYVAIVFSSGLLTLGATGLYLWFKNHNERRIGAVLLILGTATALTLIVSMRLD